MKTENLVGKRIVDMTAEIHGWPDVKGEIVEIDGSNALVRYDSNNERWKALWNLCILDDSE